MSKFIFGLATAPLKILWGAFVAAKLWTWFVVPLGVAPISLSQAAGLTCLAALLSHQAAEGDAPSWDGIARQLAYDLGMPASMLLIGFLAHWLGAR